MRPPCYNRAPLALLESSMTRSPLPLRWVLGPWLATVIAVGLLFAWSEARQAERFERQLELLRVQHVEANAGRPTAPAVAPQGPQTCPPATVDAAIIEAIAQRVAAVLEARGQAAGAQGHEHAAAPEPPPTPEQRAAVERAERVLDDALARGRLRREDVIEIRHQLAQAGRPQKEAAEIARRIAVGLNTNKLVPEDPDFVMP